MKISMPKFNPLTLTQKAFLWIRKNSEIDRVLKNSRQKYFLRTILLGVVWGGTFLGGLAFSSAIWADGAVRTELISEAQAAACGLTRPWFNQVTMDPHHDQITHVTLQDDTLFITTDNGRIHVVDIKTGTTLWSRIVGSENYHSLPPAANSFAVAIIHGTTLHIFDRFDGKKLLQIPINAPPGGGPQIGEHYVYVPILTGKIFAYPLHRVPNRPNNLKEILNENEEKLTKSEKAKKIRQAMEVWAKDPNIEKRGLLPIDEKDIEVCPSLGEPLVQPFLCSQTDLDDHFAWVTTLGTLVIANLDFGHAKTSLKLLYQIRLAPLTVFVKRNHMQKVKIGYASDINARPTYVQKDCSDINMSKEKPEGGMILLGAGSGFVLAINDRSGAIDWQYPLGLAVVDPIGAIEDRCYIPTFAGLFYCLDMKNGKELWNIDGIKQFLSSSAKRLYVIDMNGSLLTLDKETGKTIYTLPLSTGVQGIFNIESDRILIIGKDGLVQCLHEKQLETPIYYQENSMQIAKRLNREKSSEEDEEVDVEKEKPLNLPRERNKAKKDEFTPAPAIEGEAIDENDPFAVSDSKESKNENNQNKTENNNEEEEEENLEEDESDPFL